MAGRPRRELSRGPRRSARAVALDALRRIDEGAYANLVLPAVLERSHLDERDRAFATNLVYGTTRMRRACDWLVDRFLLRAVDPDVRRVLRLGAFQIVFTDVPTHAAVSATVAEAPGRARGLVNAILRRVAVEAEAGGERRWPSDAVRLSYPDWIVERLTDDLGAAEGLAALTVMDEAPAVTRRPDGYVQDLASQMVVAEAGVNPGDVVVDVCAAPGGKATAMAAAGASVVVAGDVQRSRATLAAVNASAHGYGAVKTVVADGRRPPVRPGCADLVLVDAPCSGLGVLRRRADARWRVEPADVDNLAELQRALLDASVPLVREGGTLVYSVCTLTVAETLEVDRWLASAHPDFVALDPPGYPWRGHGRGALLLPQALGTDGMFMVRLRRAPSP